MMPWASRWTGLAAGPTLCVGAPASASEWVRMVTGRTRHPTAQRTWTAAGESVAQVTYWSIWGRAPHVSEPTSRSAAA